ncbi:MAG: hypothetical protein JNL82_38480 [Myxococcales bacterium]|nr:hypothetical protein [Myxococcales bacterium]
MTLPRKALALGLTGLFLLPTEAQAFSTRIHIAIANKVREALVDAGDGKIQLRFGDHSVILDPEDVDALTNNPLAFRAGAVGPDNMVFPGMTDPSHALGQRPFEQCELLYQAALLPDERAYALGCFLHGSTDAIAHHYVNYMTGETFTLTPITSARQQSFDNVVRHILAESAIQSAAVAQDPEGFTSSKLLHTIPIGFVLRTYLNQDSPVWQMMAAHAKAEYDAYVAANPGASLPQIAAALDVGPADQLVLTPVYLATIDQAIDDTRATLVARVAELQDPGSPDGAVLQVTAGGDGELGTKDDDTDCSASCPQLYAEYFTYAGLLAPRYNAQQQELPPAFDKITEELRAEMFSFHEAYLQTVANLSAKLNEAPNGMSGEFGATKADIQAAFAPMLAWVEQIETIDYDTVVYAVVPDWLIDLETFMQAVGVDVDLAAIFKAIFDPIIQPVKDAIKQAFIEQAQVFLEQLVAEIEAKKDVVYGEYDARLLAAAHPDLGGTMLDHFYDSGLYGHAFNIAAAAIADHRAVLPVGDDPVGVGPASFDASYTPAWMQAGRCDYLREVVFPLGIDARGAMSVRDADGDFPATLADDSPIECHAGSLSEFAADPDAAVCALVKIAALLMDPSGSLSRAYPPDLSEEPGQCDGLEIPGLPAPPPDPGTTGEPETGGDAGSGGVDDSGDAPTGGADASGDAPTGGASDVTAGTVTAPTTGDTAGGDADDGCGCNSTQHDPLGLMAFGLLLALARRRRRAAALALGLAACGDSGGDDTGASTGQTTPPATASGPTTGATADPDTTADVPTTDVSTTAADTTTTGDDPGTDTTDASSTTDPTTGGGNMAGELLDALGGSVWSGEATRDGKTRVYELRFDTDSLLWSELRNPFGPSRLREMRAMQVDADGMSVHTTVIQPPGWEVHPDNGREDDWTVEVIDGSPRTLRTTRDGAVEEFTEGPWPAPTAGLTATVRVFKVGGAVDEAFCDSGPNGFEYITLFDFARGDHPDIVATDVVAGAEILTWTDPSQNNQFSISDVPGFDRHGGTVLSDTFNFFVTYTGTLTHPGGEIGMREANDSVEDAVWVFLGDKAGSGYDMDLFLEVQGFAWPDETSDEPSADFPAGDVPIEAILVRCTENISNVDLQARIAPNDWMLVGDVASKPVVNTTLFPPAI